MHFNLSYLFTLDPSKHNFTYTYISSGPSNAQYTSVAFLSENLLFVGSHKGSLALIDIHTLIVKTRLKVSSFPIICKYILNLESDTLQIAIEYLNGFILLNSSDKTLRTYTIECVNEEDYKFERLHKLQDQIDRIHWSHCTFGNEGEYVVACTLSRV